MSSLDSTAPAPRSSGEPDKSSSKLLLKWLTLPALKDVSKLAMLTWFWVAEETDRKTGDYRNGYALLRAKTGACQRSIIRAVAELVDAGLLVVEREGKSQGGVKQTAILRVVFKPAKEITGTDADPGRGCPGSSPGTGDNSVPQTGDKIVTSQAQTGDKTVPGLVTEMSPSPSTTHYASRSRSREGDQIALEATFDAVVLECFGEAGKAARRRGRTDREVAQRWHEAGVTPDTLRPILVERFRTWRGEPPGSLRVVERDVLVAAQVEASKPKTTLLQFTDEERAEAKRYMRDWDRAHRKGLRPGMPGWPKRADYRFPEPDALARGAA